MAANRTPLFAKRQPGGVLSIIDVPAHPGNIYFVDSGETTTGGDTSGFGQSPDSPFLTIDFAIGQCTASNGDVIYVMPGHTESITAAAGIAADIAGISIIGVGVGNTRPVVTFASTDNAGTWTVSANNVKIRNIVLVCNDDALTNALVVSGDNCEIDIEFQDTSAAVEAATAVRLDTADNCKLKLKYLGFTGGNAVVSAVRLDDCDNVQIEIDAYGIVTTAWVEMVDVLSTNVSVRGRMYTQGITNFTRDVVDTITSSTWDAVIFDSSAGSVISGGSAAALASDDVTALATAISTIDEFHDVPGANNTLNAQINEVIGNKTDTAASGAVTATDTLVGYTKQLVTELAVVDEFHDVPAANNTLNAQINEVIGNKTDAAAAGAVTTTDTLVGYIKQLVTELAVVDTELAVVDEFHDVPAANNTLNAQINEVIGNKEDTAAAGAVTATDTLVGYIKQLVTELAVVDNELAVVDEFHDVPAANNTLNAQMNEVLGNKEDAAAAGAVTATDTLVGYTKQLVTELAVIDEFHDVPAANNTLNAQINEVIGNKTDATAAGDVTATDTIVAYLKQLVTELSGSAGISTWPAAAAPTDGVSLAEAVRFTAENQLSRFASHVKADVTAVTAWTTGNSPITLFTVTGDVLARCFASVQTSLTSTATNGTLELGVAGLTAGLLVQDVVDGAAFQTGDAWTLITAADAPGAQLADEWLFIAGGSNIILTIATNSMTAGAITVYCEYIPISAGAGVVTT